MKMFFYFRTKKKKKMFCQSEQMVQPFRCRGRAAGDAVALTS
jgi:hypothetical protein